VLPADINKNDNNNGHVHFSDAHIWNQFSSKADSFMKYTSNYAHQDISPGGYYSAIWMRDAAYIIKDHFLLAGNTATAVLEQILLIWSHQINSISADKEKKIVYGRGSPETNFQQLTKDIGEIGNKFDGALPTTIFQDFCDIYGLNPDIDSTALMVSSTSWILFTTCTVCHYRNFLYIHRGIRARYRGETKMIGISGSTMYSSKQSMML
jgi:hypothetical protein